jgi:hypothetical protein
MHASGSSFDPLLLAQVQDAGFYCQIGESIDKGRACKNDSAFVGRQRMFANRPTAKEDLRNSAARSVLKPYL